MCLKRYALLRTANKDRAFSGTSWEVRGWRVDGSWDKKVNPVQIGSLTDWQSVVASYSHAMAMRTGKSLWAWGDNAYGQLGDGTTVRKFSFVRIGAPGN